MRQRGGSSTPASPCPPSQHLDWWAVGRHTLLLQGVVVVAVVVAGMLSCHPHPHRPLVPMRSMVAQPSLTLWVRRWGAECRPLRHHPSQQQLGEPAPQPHPRPLRPHPQRPTLQSLVPETFLSLLLHLHLSLALGLVQCRLLLRLLLHPHPLISKLLLVMARLPLHPLPRHPCLLPPVTLEVVAAEMLVQVPHTHLHPLPRRHPWRVSSWRRQWSRRLHTPFTAAGPQWL